jgi:hypothetical protein
MLEEVIPWRHHHTIRILQAEYMYRKSRTDWKPPGQLPATAHQRDVASPVGARASSSGWSIIGSLEADRG